MTRKVHFIVALALLFSLVLSACATPTPAPVPTQAPAPTQAVVVEEPVVVAEPELDMTSLLGDFIAALPADQKFFSVTPADLNLLLAEKAPFILDVRQVSEIEASGYIKGAVHVEIRELMQNLDKLPAKDQKIVVACASGHRGGYAMAALRLLGYTDVFNLNGGMNAWIKAGLPVETGLPAAAESISTPDVDPILLAYFDNYLGGLPTAGFGSVKNDALNTELAEGKKIFLLDVRRQAEWDSAGYIDGSVLVPVNDLPANLDKLPADKDAAIVVICASGHRGAVAQMYLQTLGYTNVRNLNGGLNGWKNAKLPVAGWVDWPATYADFLTNLPADQGYYTISASKLNELLVDKPPFILDVREPAEVESVGYIAGTVNIPVREVLKNLDKLPAQDQKIVVTCASGHRGAMVMMALRLLGYQDVVNLGGGINGWKKAELPLESGKPADAAATGATPTVDKTRLAGLDAYLSALPEGFFTVKASDLNTELAAEKKPFILDVRTAEELTKDGYIEGALNISINELPARLAELPADKATPIIILCKSGHRGALGMMYLQSLGYTNVRNLAGGMNAWIAAELPVVK